MGEPSSSGLLGRAAPGPFSPDDSLTRQTSSCLSCRSQAPGAPNLALPLRLAPLSLLLDIACWAHMARQAPRRLAGVLVSMAPVDTGPPGRTGLGHTPVPWCQPCQSWPPWVAVRWKPWWLS